jgi:hypothetical protein
MNLEEKYLYHQIHPLKLFTDWSTGIIALYPLWQHKLALALVIALIPPPIASFLLMRFADLEKYKESAFGKYIRKYMTRQVEAIRFAGYIIMAVGAWTHIIWFIPVGLVIILFGWLRGRIFPGKST